MSRTISSSSAGPVILGTADNPLYITSTGTVTATGSADGIDGDASTSWTISNAGVVSAAVTGNGVSLAGSGVVSNTGSIAGNDAVLLKAGGSVTNDVGGSLSGLGALGGGLGFGAGVDIAGATGTVTNRSTISGVAYGVALGAGGQVTNAAVITGGEDGVIVAGAAGTIANSGSITATVDDGIGLFAGGSVTNASGATISATGTKGAGVFVTGAAGTVANAGTIAGSHVGVALAAGGALSNAASGSISAQTLGVYFQNQPGTFTNAGDVTATGAQGTGLYMQSGGSVTNLSTGTIAGEKFGAFFDGGAGTLANYGSISGGTYDGAVLGLGGSVTNAANASISGLSIGVYVKYKAAGSVTNSGTISGSGTASAGIDLADGGGVTNNSTGSVSGSNFGVFVTGAAGTVANAGSITTTKYGGVELTKGGSVTNSAGGSIKGGSAGVYAQTGGPATVINTGTINAASASGAGVALAGGGNVTNNSGGSISGGGFGVFTTGTVATLSNSGSISGSHGVGFEAGGNLTNAVSASIAGQVAGVFSQAGAAALSNAGSITASATGGAGADIEAGGNITNVSTGLISGNFFGVFVTGAAGTISNAGSIASAKYAAVELTRGGSITNSAGGSIAGGSGGVYVQAGAVGTVTNSGTINATNASGTGVALGGGGSITNNLGGSISGGSFGVFASGAPATLTNSGSISGSHAIGLQAGGSITNNAGGSIVGQVAGVFSSGAPVTVSNAGAISATAGTALDIEGGGNIANLAGASIAGSAFGIFLTGGSATVTNAGTISGGSYAIDFAGSGTNRLVVDPGAVFVGGVTGGSGTSTLELASGTGSIGGVGTGSFNHFQVLAIDAGGTWTLPGANIAPTVLDNGTVSIAGSLDVSTAIDPSSSGVFKLASGATLEVAAATGSATQINFQGGAGELIVDNAALFGTGVGTASYTGPQLQQFAAADEIDLKNFSSVGVTLNYNALTGLLQVSNSANQVASLQFQASSAMSFAATSDGGSGIFITDPPPPVPIVTSIVTSGAGVSSGSGDLNAGNIVNLTVNFSSNVTVDTTNGSPTLTLNDGGLATYVGGSGTSAIAFSYTVGSGQNTPDLVVASLNLNGATIRDVTANNANLTGATNYNPAGALQIDTAAPTIAISTIASNNIISATKASQGFKISGSTTGVENGQSVLVNILNSASVIVDSYTTQDTSNAWSVSVTGAQAIALADGSYTVTANVSDKAGNPARAATHVLTVDEDRLPEAPALTIGNLSPTVQAGGSISLGITATPVDFDDRLSVKISGVPGYETISAPGYTVTQQLQANGTSTWTITESSSKAGTALTGITLSSNYTGTGHPAATLTVTARNITTGETATSPSQLITVTDPPAATSNPLPSLPQIVASRFGLTDHGAPVGSAPPAYTKLAVLLDQFMAASSGADAAGSVRSVLNISLQGWPGDREFLAKPHS